MLSDANSLVPLVRDIVAVVEVDLHRLLDKCGPILKTVMYLEAS